MPVLQAVEKLERYAPGGEDTDTPSWRREGAIVLYWLGALALALLFRLPEPFTFNIPQTVASIWGIGLLIATLGFSQWLYTQVAVHEDRPFNWLGTPIFIIGNSLGETLAFLLVFKFGLFAGNLLSRLIDLTGIFSHLIIFSSGFFIFLIYGGMIHGLFWMRIFPPHFREDERALKIRKFRLWSESALSFSWCLVFYVFKDFWSVVIFHAVVDAVLMIRVRPRIFRFVSGVSGAAG
ncbi:MAG: hypothetical protein NZ585_10855 [Chloracidobacterium sp.]|nr:hypothetical protein [Chloracidobacterium sp.]MDW8217712.1 hypothetical protein [Acidobacteriota bacterium]